MRPLPVKISTGFSGWIQLKASWKKNYLLYLREALGLGIFMISACFFGSLLESRQSTLHEMIPDASVRNGLMGILMGATALFIFYSPLTAPSGSHINPAASLSFWRLGKLCHWDLLFYILFQYAGGVLAVYLMQGILGNSLQSPPVNSVVTVPGKYGAMGAIVTEFLIATITMLMIQFTSSHAKWKKYTRLLSSLLVCCWVILAGPISGFGMNPARSFASAWPAGNWDYWWIYQFVPVAGMLLATELFLITNRIQQKHQQKKYSES
jgi:aquaporin Z